MKNHEYSWEILYHFNCGECKNWWSIATTENRYQCKNKVMNCPHCGYRTKIQPKNVRDGFPIVRNSTPGYPLPDETTKDMVVDSKVSETTADEKAKFVANEIYHESSDRDNFARPKVYSDGRGGIYTSDNYFDRFQHKF